MFMSISSIRDPPRRILSVTSVVDSCAGLVFIKWMSRPNSSCVAEIQQFMSCHILHHKMLFIHNYMLGNENMFTKYSDIVYVKIRRISSLLHYLIILPINIMPMINVGIFFCNTNYKPAVCPVSALDRWKACLPKYSPYCAIFYTQLNNVHQMERNENMVLQPCHITLPLGGTTQGISPAFIQ